MDFASLTKVCVSGVHVCTYVHKGACILVLAGFVLSATQVEVTHVCALIRQCEALS